MRDSRLLARVGFVLVAAAITLSPLVLRGDDSAFFDSTLDGVWVGTVKVKTGSGTRPLPFLLSLDADDASVRGVALLPDSLSGAIASYDFHPLGSGTIKGKKLQLEVTVAGPGARAEASHGFTLRLRKGALKGKLVSTDPDVKASKVELRPAGGEEPLQHFWLGSLPESRGRADSIVALALFASGKTGGAGMVGDAAGEVKRANVVGDRVTATLATDAGDIDLDLQLSRNGLNAALAGAANGETDLLPGGLGKAPAVNSFKPSTLPAGNVTEVTIKGKNLVPGLIAHLDHPGAYAEPVEHVSGKRARVRVFVPANTAQGTALGLQIVTPAGTTVDPKKGLKSGAPSEVSYTKDIEPIFIARCALAFCHIQPPQDDPAYPDDAEPAGGMVLSRGIAYSSIVNVTSRERPALKRIDPGNPDGSYLILKIKGDPSIEGERMPFGGPYLSPEVIDMFVRWVQQGAKRN